MDVINVAKRYLAVGVGRVGSAVLISSTFEFVGSCIEQGPCVVNFNLAILVELRAIAHANLPD